MIYNVAAFVQIYYQTAQKHRHNMDEKWRKTAMNANKLLQWIQMSQCIFWNVWKVQQMQLFSLLRALSTGLCTKLNRKD